MVALDEHRAQISKIYSAPIFFRRQLAAEEATFAGLYAGNATRETARPKAARLLEAFQEVTLTVVEGSLQVIAI